MSYALVRIEDAPWTGEVFQSRRGGGGYPVGGTVLVLVDPERPERSEIADPSHTRSAALMMAAGGCFMLAFAWWTT